MNNIVILLATWSLVAAMMAVMAYGLRDGIRSVRQYLALQNAHKSVAVPVQAATAQQRAKGKTAYRHTARPVLRTPVAVHGAFGFSH